MKSGGLVRGHITFIVGAHVQFSVRVFSFCGEDKVFYVFFGCGIFIYATAGRRIAVSLRNDAATVVSAAR